MSSDTKAIVAGMTVRELAKAVHNSVDDNAPDELIKRIRAGTAICVATGDADAPPMPSKKFVLTSYVALQARYARKSLERVEDYQVPINLRYEIDKAMSYVRTLEKLDGQS